MEVGFSALEEAYTHIQYKGVNIRNKVILLFFQKLCTELPNGLLDYLMYIELHTTTLYIDIYIYIYIYIYITRLMSHTSNCNFFERRRAHSTL